MAQAKQTNGRVNEIENKNLPEKVKIIEKDTRVVRFIHRYPKSSIIILLVLYFFTIKEIRDATFKVFDSSFHWIIKFVL